MFDIDRLQEMMKWLFPEVLGVRFSEASKDRVEATFEVRDDLCTLPGVLHGGAVMAFADTLGAVATALNLPKGASTTTIESKTNFLAAGRGGSTVHGECTPLHRGRRTMVWQTRVTNADGRLLAMVTQTQAVLEAVAQPMDALATLFAGKSPHQQKLLLADLEHSGAAMYRTFAAAEADEAKRAELLRAAEREEANAAVLKKHTAGG